MLVDKQSELISDLLFTVHQHGGHDVTWKPPIAWKIDKHVMFSYLLLFDKRLEFDFFLNSIQNSHFHEPSKLVENLQHLHITTEKNLTSNHGLKLKSLGFSVLKYIVLTFCLHSIETLAAFAF